jgi:chemotaxis protein CheC
MDDPRSLKAIQMDALREVANIGAGHAATALSQMIGETIMISVPTINVSRLEEIPPQVAAPDEPVAAVLMHMLGDLTGRTCSCFRVARRVGIASLLLRRPSGPDDFSEMEQSAIKEAGNILSSAYMNALSDFMGMMLIPSPPSLAVDMSSAVLTTAYLQFGSDKDYVFCVESEFLMDNLDEHLRGFFLLLPDTASLHAIPQGRSRRVARRQLRCPPPHVRKRSRSAAIICPADRSVGRGAHNNLGVLYYNKGLYEEACLGVHERARARPEDGGRAAQSRDRVFQHGILRHAYSRAERAHPSSSRGS